MEIDLAAVCTLPPDDTASCGGPAGHWTRGYQIEGDVRVGVLWGEDRDMSTKQTRISSPYDMQISAIDKLQRAQYNCGSIQNRQFMPEYYLQGMRVRSKNHQVATVGKTSGSITFGADLPEPSPDVLRNHLVTDSSILPPPSRSPTYPACKSSTLACRRLRPSSTRLPAGRLIDYSSSEDEAEEQ